METGNHVLVLGGTGFLGQPLVRQLLLEDKARLTVLVHRKGTEPLPSPCRVVRGHLAWANLNWCREDPPAIVFHCARLSGVGRAGRLRSALVGNLANRRLIRWLRGCAQAPRLIYASGSLMYGDHGEEWVDERTPLRPTSFARQYIVAERPFLKAIQSQELPVMMARPGWVIGNGSWLERFYLEPSSRIGAVPLYGAGNSWMSFIHREDCARAMRQLAKAGEPGKAYNVTVPGPLRQREFVTRLAEMLELRVQAQELSGNMRDPAVREAFESSIKLRTVQPLMEDLQWQFPSAFSALEAVIPEHTKHTPPSTKQA